MTTQNYLIIEDNIVTNVVLWDGNKQTWMPPVDSIQLIQAITPAMVWTTPTIEEPSVLQEIVGSGNIGFTWNGTVLTTNEPQPEQPKLTTQPETTGLNTA